jgi:hypothetical protein
MESHGERGRLVALVAESIGAKQEFSYQEAWETLTTHLNRATPFEQVAWQHARPRRSWGFWVEENRDSLGARTPLMHHERRSVEIIDRINQEPLSGVEFWGPLRSQRFGLIGFLADLRTDQGHTR